MSDKPGFDIANINVEKRAKDHDEFVYRCVLSKNIRVLFIPNEDRLPTKELAKKFLREIVMYNNEKDCNALSWAKPAGSFKGTSNFRAEMTSSFWDFFMEQGRKNLMDYNKINKCSIKVVRDKTLKLSDAENLSLYLRKKIMKYCENNKLKICEVLVKNGMVTLKNQNHVKKYKATTLAIKLGWNYSDWKGAAIKTMLSEEEKIDYEEGRIKWKSITLENIFDPENTEEDGNTEIVSGTTKSVELPNEEQRGKKRRDADEMEMNVQKLPRCEVSEENSEE